MELETNRMSVGGPKTWGKSDEEVCVCALSMCVYVCANPRKDFLLNPSCLGVLWEFKDVDTGKRQGRGGIQESERDQGQKCRIPLPKRHTQGDIVESHPQSEAAIAGAVVASL